VDDGGDDLLVGAAPAVVDDGDGEGSGGRGYGRSQIVHRSLLLPGGVRGGERARSAADGVLVQVAVDGGAGHAEDAGDLLAGVRAGVVELLGEGGLLRELSAASCDTAAA
jgi:hypothetical protein